MDHPFLEPQDGHSNSEGQYKTKMKAKQEVSSLNIPSISAKIFGQALIPTMLYVVVG